MLIEPKQLDVVGQTILTVIQALNTVIWVEDQSMDYAFLVDDCMFKSPNGRKIV